MIKTKAELLQRMREHPELVLQYCHGIRGNGWWWLREGESPNTTPVHGGSAHALRRSGVVLHKRGKSPWDRETNYVLAETDAEATRKRSDLG